MSWDSLMPGETVKRFSGQIGPELGVLGRNLHPGSHRAPAEGIALVAHPRGARAARPA